MEKKEFKDTIKSKLKHIGFKTKGNHYYKIIDDNYLIGVSLSDRAYCRAYFVDYGIIYLPDEEKIPFKGDFDWTRKFWFTKNYGKPLERYQLDDLEKYYEELMDYFEYDKRSVEELESLIDINIDRMLFVLSDKKCAIRDYQNNLDLFVSLSEHEIKKFIRLGAISKQTVLQHRVARGYSDNSFLEELS